MKGSKELIAWVLPIDGKANSDIDLQINEHTRIETNYVTHRSKYVSIRLLVLIKDSELYLHNGSSLNNLSPLE